MKHLILFIFILMPFLLVAQNTDKNTFDMDEKNLFNNVYEKTLEVLRVKIVSDISESLIATKIKGFYDTTTDSDADTLSKRLNVNSLSSEFSSWFQYSIVSDDTVQVSSDINFGTGNTELIIPDIPFTSNKLDISSITELYYKRYGTDGTPNVYINVEGK